MAVELRIVVDNTDDNQDAIIRAYAEGRILSVNAIPEACPKCAYTPYCLDYCTLNTHPKKSEFVKAVDDGTEVFVYICNLCGQLLEGPYSVCYSGAHFNPNLIDVIGSAIKSTDYVRMKRDS